MTRVTGSRRWLRSLRARLLMMALAYSPNPIYPSFGWGAGTPVDRHFIDLFLSRERASVQGRVLEVGGREYTAAYGGDRVTRSDVLSAVASDDPSVIVADLSAAPQIADDTYDCIILTQTLHYVFDMPKAIAELHRILRPGGSLLLTVPGISQISTWDMERWGDRWRLTDLAVNELLATRFDPDAIQVSTYGNAASAVSFLQGIPAEKLSPKVLSTVNREYQVLVAASARKSGA